MDVDLDDFLECYPPETRSLFHELQAFVREAVPDDVELVYDAYNAFGINYSLTDQLRDGFTTVAAYTKHVNLGFNRGAELPDPRCLLEGKGKTWRHVKVTSMAGLNKKAARQLIVQARALAEASCPRDALAKPYPDRILKAVYEKKRRPSSS